jgi:hypothetical protein
MDMNSKTKLAAAFVAGLSGGAGLTAIGGPPTFRYSHQAPMVDVPLDQAAEIGTAFFRAGAWDGEDGQMRDCILRYDSRATGPAYVAACSGVKEATKDKLPKGARLVP